MSRLPPALARQIDRLARHAHRFHRFAHHPLCHEYRCEVVRLGRRTRVCRGCLLCALGLLVGAVAGTLLRLGTGRVLICVGLAVALVGAAAATRWLRRIKLVTRFAPAALLGCAAISGVRAGPPWGWAAAGATVTAALAGVALYRRRGPDRTPCTTCPERTQPTPCRGLAPVVRRERAFRRLAGRMIARAR